MAVYFLTGFLGAGKSLSAVARIHQYLFAGRIVATNLDLRLAKLVGKKNKNCRVVRLPDKPTVEDLEALPCGNDSYDESKNGLIVLDELATWFNSRSWADQHRQKVINWLLHSRKKGWDVVFIVQEIDLIDKQVKKSMCQNVVVCTPLTNIHIPWIGWIIKPFLSLVPFPKTFLATIKYRGKIVTGHWFVVGSKFYSCYDTKQEFRDDYPHGVYSVLPPWYSVGRFSVIWSRVNIMRITKILWRKWSRPVVFGSGCVLTLFLAFGVGIIQSRSSEVDVVDPVEQVVFQFPEFITKSTITGYYSGSGKDSVYYFSSEKNKFSSDELLAQGYSIVDHGKNRCEIIKGGSHANIYR